MRVILQHSLGLLLFFVLGMGTALADDLQDPVDMLRTASDKMIADLKKHRKEIKNNMDMLYDFVKADLLPHVDLRGMSRSVLGRNQWGQASEQQRQQFIEEFSVLMVRTYGSALQSYSDEKIRFLPLRQDPNKETRIQVDSVIIQSGGPSIPVSYRLIKKKSGWKVYDMIVDSISLLQSFRSQFASELADGDLNQLLETLAKHNKDVDP